MDLVIVNYGAGNIQSIRFAFQRLGYTLELSSDPDRIRKADKVIFPGVGEASSAMAKLTHSGLDALIPEPVDLGRHLFGGIGVLELGELFQ